VHGLAAFVVAAGAAMIVFTGTYADNPMMLHMKTGCFALASRLSRRPSSRAVAAILGIAVLAVTGCAGNSEQPTEQSDKELVWPLPPEPPRIRYLGSIRSRADIGATDKISLADSLLGAKDQSRIKAMKKPYGVHVDKDGRMFVTDTGWGKLLVFDAPNKKFAVWGAQGRGTLAKPIGVTSDSMGRVYVTDVAQHRVLVFDSNGEFVTAMGDAGELRTPTGIALDEKRRRIYVVDTRKHDIAVYDFEGRRISTIGERGGAPGQFNFPTNVAVGRDGRIYVTDSMNFRIQILAPDGRSLKTFGSNGDRPGQFSRAKGIAVDSDGHIYVVDAAFNNYQIFDQDGRLMLYVGSIGQNEGQFWLPAGAYMAPDDVLYVVDQYNFRVQKFQYISHPDVKSAVEPAAAAPAQ